MTDLVYFDLGRAAYDPVLELQERLVHEVKESASRKAYLILVEHDPPVITLGRSAKPEHIIASPQKLAQMGIEVRKISRGGDVTYHSPGQIVGYPIMRIDSRSRNVHKFMRDIEQVLIDVLESFGITAGRREGFTGVWVGDEKIAAIGIAVRRWVSYHGFALNVTTDLTGFESIVPCGLADKSVTSMSAILGRDVPLDLVKAKIVECVAKVFELSPRRRLPQWLRKRIPAGSGAKQVTDMLGELSLVTVCDSAQCPNRAECYSRRIATFMILGDRCTRNCRFCAVPTGSELPPPRHDEPSAVAQACLRLNLRHVVITSVTRDDLPDGGAGHFARTIEAVRKTMPDAIIEVLTPDFQGNEQQIDIVLDAVPNIFNHNVETVPELYPIVRPQAGYAQSLGVLEHVKLRAESASRKKIHTKSGLMLGLGETDSQVQRVLSDLRRVGCDILTIGQYLAPSPNHLPVSRYVEPSEFDQWKHRATQMGFLAVAAGPFVRSSYQAGELFDKITN